MADKWQINGRWIGLVDCLISTCESRSGGGEGGVKEE